MKRSPLATPLLACVCLALAACASTAHDVPAKTVPMTAYNEYPCQDLLSEYSRVSLEADELAKRIDQGLLAERLKMGVGVVLFWPALLLIEDQTEQHQRLASLKGERKTLSDSVKARNCQSDQPREKPARQVQNATPDRQLARL